MKKTIICFIFSVVVLSCLSSVVIAGNEITRWRDNHPAAVSLAFDDGYLSQVQNAIPLLNSKQIKGTFFLVTGFIPGNGVTWGQWGQLAAQGHEIGSHSVSHPDLTQLPMARVIEELSESQETINSNIPSQSCVSFAYPGCSVNDQVESLTSNYYFAARSCVVPYDRGGGYLNHYDTAGWWSGMDFYNIAAYPLSDNDNGDYSAAQDLQSYLSAAKDYSGWFVPYIHEVPPGKVKFYNQFLDDLMARGFWIAPFGTVARYMKERLSSQLIIVSESSSEVKLNLTHSLAGSIYNEPLTIRSTIPSGWQNVRVQQGDSVDLVAHLDEGAERVVYFNAVPNGGIITLSEGPAEAALLELKIEEGGGNTAFDSSGFNNNGAINGAVYKTDSAVGAYALSFDGVSNYVACKGTGSLKPSELSVAFWFKHAKDTSSPNYGGIIKGAYGDGYSNGFRILDYNNGPVAQLNFGDAGPISIVGNSLTQGKWYHIVITYDHEKIRLYQNGALVREISETRDINWGSSSVDLYIGWAEWYFKGLVDKATMYNYSLNAQEVQGLYDQKPKLVYIANNQNINSIDSSEYIVKKNLDTGSLNYLPYSYNYPKNPDGWANPEGLTFVGNKLFISGFIPGTGNPSGMWEIDPNNGAELSYIPTAVGQPAGLASDGKDLFVCEYYGSLAKIYRYNTSGQQISSFTVPVLMNGLAYGAGYLFGSNKNKIYQINPNNGAIINTFTVPLSNVVGLGFVNGDSSYLVATAYLNSNIYRFNLDADLKYTGISSIITFVRGGYAYGVALR